jgi:hypothetical protein
MENYIGGSWLYEEWGTETSCDGSHDPKGNFWKVQTVVIKNN